MDVPLPSFAEPEDDMEPSINDLTGLSAEEHIQERLVTYRVIQEGTKRGKSKLVDSIGHAYTVKVNIYYIILLQFYSCTLHRL